MKDMDFYKSRKKLNISSFPCAKIGTDPTPKPSWGPHFRWSWGMPCLRGARFIIDAWGQRQIEHMGLTIEDLTNIRQVSGRDEMIWNHMKSSCQCLGLKNSVILCVWKEEYSLFSPAASVVQGTPDFFQLPLAARTAHGPFAFAKAAGLVAWPQGLCHLRISDSLCVLPDGWLHRPFFMPRFISSRLGHY